MIFMEVVVMVEPIIQGLRQTSKAAPPQNLHEPDKDFRKGAEFVRSDGAGLSDSFTTE